jgi:hypothetical protein
VPHVAEAKIGYLLSFIGTFFIAAQGALQRDSDSEVALTCPASPQYDGSMGFNLYHAPSSRQPTRGKFLSLYSVAFLTTHSLGCQ